MKTPCFSGFFMAFHGFSYDVLLRSTPWPRSSSFMGERLTLPFMAPGIWRHLKGRHSPKNIHGVFLPPGKTLILYCLVVWNVIIPTDWPIFFRGVAQPPTSIVLALKLEFVKSHGPCWSLLDFHGGGMDDVMSVLSIHWVISGSGIDFLEIVKLETWRFNGDLMMISDD